MLYVILVFFLVLLQRGADPSIRNTDGKTALDLADPLSKSVLTGTVMYGILHMFEFLTVVCFYVLVAKLLVLY